MNNGEIPLTTSSLCAGWFSVIGRNSAVGVASKKSLSIGSSNSTCAHVRKPKTNLEMLNYLDSLEEDTHVLSP